MKLCWHVSILINLKIVVVFVVTLVLVRGIKESASVNAGMVALKVFIVVFVILVGMAYIDNDNYSPFLPYGFFGISFFGYTAVGQSDKGGNAVGACFAETKFAIAIP